MNTASVDTRLLLLFASAGFVSVASTRICDAMLPALATSLRTTTAEAAVAVSAYAIAYGVMQVFYGPLGDRFGKPRVIVFALAWCTASSLLSAMAPSLQSLVLARAAMGMGAAAIVPLAVAWIGDTVPLGQRQQVLAKFSGITVFGITLGPLLGGLLAQALDWRAAFVLLAVCFAVMTAMLLLRGCAAPEPALASAGAVRPIYRHQVAALLRQRWARVVLLAGCLEAAWGVGSLAFVPTVLHTRFALTLLEGGAVAATFGLGGFLFTRAAPTLLRRLAPSALPGMAGLVLAAAYALLACMPHWSVAVAACLLAGFGFFALHNTLQLQATQLAAGSTGLAVSLFSGSIFVGQSIGVTVGAWVLASASSAWVFGAAALGLLGLGLGLRRALQRRDQAAGAAVAGTA